MKNIEFIKSSPDEASCPQGGFPEYAFIGRSNVGKSSLINSLTDKKKLAKTSGTPGRTRLINHFKVDDQWYLVDLPGYGYAKVSKSDREKLEKMIKDYVLNRKQLICLFVLVDCRHEPQKKDLDFIEWLGIEQIPFAICFTKIDKLSESNLARSVENYKQVLLKSWEELPSIFCTSATNNKGKEDILGFIENINKSIGS